MTTVPKTNNCYENLMIISIEESLSTLVEQSRHLINNFLAKKHNLEKDQIPCNVEIFSKALESLLGDGTKFLEFLIMKRFNEKIGNIFQLEDGEICNYMMAATEFSKKIVELMELEKKSQILSIDDQKQEVIQNEHL